MRPLLHPELSAIPLAAVLHALADPVRLALVRNLDREGEMNCTASSGALRLPKSTLSNHYRVLREAGLVRTRLEGKQAVNRLRREELEARFPGLLDAVLRAAEDGAAAGQGGTR
jgi:DNA-binding transcriptional ArsR family regulator